MSFMAGADYYGDIDNEAEYRAEITAVLKALEGDDEALRRFMDLLENTVGPTWMRIQEPGVLYYELPRFPLFIRIGGWRNPALTAAATALDDLVSHDVPLAVAAGVIAELASRFLHLNDYELGVFDVLGRLAQGGSIYKVWIDEFDLLRGIATEFPNLYAEDCTRLVASMKSRGLLEEGAGKWRAVF
jgi:hypothetical protein